MSDYEEDTTCPLCMDPLDATDQAINFCQCGYKMCLWCWNQLMETASREALPGRCPNCRTEYDKEKITMAQLDPDVVQREQQRRKEQTKKKGTADTQHRPPRALGQVRVVQRNLVYAVGMPLSICREDVLANKDYFGAFGRIKKVSVNRSTPFSQVQKNGPSGSAYVTYFRPEDALRCIEAVDGSEWGGKTIKACFGTTKYCNAFLKGVPCNNPECLYLHDIAEPGDSFSKEDMMANGLQSGRNTFFDLVHPTNTIEASAHAHAALQSLGSGSGGGAVSSGGAVCSSTGGPAGSAAARAASQPVAITGVRRSSSATPWGSSGGDGPATASPSKPGAAAMAAAAAARWGSLPRATPPTAVPLNSPLADVEWPSLGAAADAADAPKHAAADNHHGVLMQAASSSKSTAAGQHLQHPSASASAHPVSHPVLKDSAAAPTAAAVVAGKVPAAAAAAAVLKQQQQQQQKTMVSLPKNAKTVVLTPIKAGTAAAPTTPPPPPPPAPAPAGKGKQAKAEAAATAKAEAAVKEAQQQQQPVRKDSKPDVTAVTPPPAAAGAAVEGATPTSSSSRSKAAQANGKLTKHEAKKAAKAAAKQAAKEAEEEAAAAKAAKGEAVRQAQVANEAAAAAGKAADANGAAGSPVKAAAAAAAKDQAVAPLPAAAAAPSPGSKIPPPGFAGPTAARVKGPPPGFQGAAAAAQQRPPPPGFEPSLLALARAGSSTSLSQTGQGSSGGGAPPGMGAAAAAAAPGMSPLGILAAAGAAASGAASPAVAGSANSGELGSRRSSDLDGAAAAAAPSDELALSTGSASRPHSHAGSVYGTAVTPAKPASSDAAAAAPSPLFSPPLVSAQPQQQQQQQQHSLFGAAGNLSPLLGFQTHSAPQQLFGAPAAVSSSSSSAFDVNAFFDPVGSYSGAAAVGTTGSVPAGGSLFGSSPLGTPITPSPLAAATASTAALGSSLPSSTDGAVPLSARKQSRFSFAQQPQQQQGPAAPPILQQQAGFRAPPGFAGFGGPAAAAAAAAGDLNAAVPGNAAAAAGLGGFGSGAFAGQHAASFFKNLLPGVNVHVAASPPTPPATGLGALGSYPPAVGVAGVAPFPMQAAPVAAPNPGLALLQQLQRGSQQHL